jgi:hypothetical protein
MTDAARIYGLWLLDYDRWMTGGDDWDVAAYMTHEKATEAWEYWNPVFDNRLEIRVIGTLNTPQGEEQING